MIAENAAASDYARDVQTVAEALRQHPGPFVVLSHENPDGDALGSALGLSRALRALGKPVVTPLRPPQSLAFVVRPGELSEPLEQWPAGALAVVVDVDNNDPDRVAGAPLRDFGGEVVNIDHHGTNLRRASAVLVDPSKPAAALMVADVVEALGAPWDEEIATALMLGLITDTGNFSFDSVTDETFLCAARLRRSGARLGWLNEQLRQNPRAYYLLMREVLSTLEFLYGGRVVLARVNEEMLARAGANWEQTEAYIGQLRNAEGAQLAVLVKDYGQRAKLSLRSRGPVSAQRIAVELGGGGHVPAAGASVDGEYATVRARLEEAVARELARVDSAEPAPA